MMWSNLLGRISLERECVDLWAEGVGILSCMNT